MRTCAVLLGVSLLMGFLPSFAKAADFYTIGKKDFELPTFLKSIQGINPYQVFQRDEKGFGKIAFQGELAAPIEGKIEARITKGSSTVLNWKTVGKATGEKFIGEITGVPTGGEYTAELRFPDGKTCSFSRLMVGDLWVIAGQSNADGCAKLVNLEEPSAMVHAFYLDDRWGVAKDPLVWFSTSIDRAHWDGKEEDRKWAIQGERYFRQYGAGMGVRFGKEMVKHTGVPVGIVPCSHTATNMDQWNPALKSEGGKSLYGAMIRRINALGGKVAGVIWYQGEADANAGCSPAYKQKVVTLVKSIREDLGQPDLPFLYAQLAIYLGDGDTYFPHWNIIQQDQLDLEKEIKNSVMVATADLTMSDWIHLDAMGQRKLGARMAYEARMIKFHEKGLQRGPRAVEARVDSTRKLITVRFEGVNGKLRPVSRVMGFQVDDGQVQPIESIRVDKDSILIRMEKPVGPKASLWHGRGYNPAVNLTDSAGFLVPVFGPMPIK